MRKTILLTFALLLTLAFQNIFSKTIDVQTAQKIALTYYKFNASTGEKSYVLKLAYTRLDANNAAVDYYVFDIYPKGFVIVSADDNAQPILAFSEETFFDPNVPNTGINDWMDDVANTMSYIITNRVPATPQISADWIAYTNNQNPDNSRAAAVAPLLKTTWSQSPYYNQDCPGGSVTGCVATAMAQIMKFWGFPTKGTSSYSYNFVPYGNLSANFGTTTYAWKSMPNALTATSTTTQINAVATLMYQAGVSVAMAYSPSGSGAYVIQSENPGGPCAQYSYVEYFGYSSKTILGVRQASYNSSKWNSMIMTEMEAGRPIQYEGFGIYGGHTWVLDGYKGSRYMYHMNWGWGGLDNGYYVVTDLNPSGIPLGTNNGAIFGIEPATKSMANRGGNKFADNNNLSNGQPVELTGPGLAPTEAFNVYPIPATNTLNVKYNGSIFSNATIMVSNALGQTVASHPSVNLTGIYPLDISNYAPGVYFVSFITPTGDDRKVIKFFKQ